jgi:hypothetical protein
MPCFAPISAQLTAQYVDRKRFVVVYLPAGERALERGAERALERAGGAGATCNSFVTCVVFQAAAQCA